MSLLRAWGRLPSTKSRWDDDVSAGGLTERPVARIVRRYERPYDVRHLPGDYSLALTLAAAVFSQVQ
jgi:hypothetical protein